MYFRILGPLEATTAEGTVRLGGRRQQRLLALLLTRVNDVVTLDRLVEGLWEEAVPHTAHAHVDVVDDAVAVVVDAVAHLGHRAAGATAGVARTSAGRTAATTRTAA